MIQLALGLLAILKIINQDDFFNYIKKVIQDLFNKGLTDKSSLETFYNIQKKVSFWINFILLLKKLIV